MRIKAIFRRIEFEKSSKNEHTLPILCFEDIEINQQRKTVKIAGNTIELTPTEYNLLTYLMENREKAVSRNELLNKIWGYNSEVETRAADDTVRRLRKKIQQSSALIDTVWGFGFRLTQEDGVVGVPNNPVPVGFLLLFFLSGTFRLFQSNICL